jgi:hypothetical protein
MTDKDWPADPLHQRGHSIILAKALDRRQEQLSLR